jgi:hypothetical protein
MKTVMTAFYFTTASHATLLMSLAPRRAMKIAINFPAFTTDCEVTPLERWLVLFSLMLLPWMVVEGIRAARAMKSSEGAPYPEHFVFIPLLPTAAVATYGFWAPAFEATHLPIGKILLSALLPISALSMFTFVCSAAFVGSVERGEIVDGRKKEAALLLLSALVKAGGFFGLIVARRVFSRFEAVDELPGALPEWLPGIVLTIWFVNFFLSL